MAAIVKVQDDGKRQKVLTVNGLGWQLDGVDFFPVGFRTASASQTDSYTDELIANLSDYAAHGINTISVFCMGSSGGADDPFNSTGTIWDADHKRRMLSIIDAANANDMVVIVGIFYGKVVENGGTITLSDWDASVEAVRTVAQALKDHNARNVILNIANENNSPSYVGEPFANVSTTNSDTNSIIECIDAAHTVWSSLIVGGGGYDDSKNQDIAEHASPDVVLFDTCKGCTPGDTDTLGMYNLFEPVSGGHTKPAINVETWGGWTKEQGTGSEIDPEGDYSSTSPVHTKNLYRDDCDDAFTNSIGWLAHCNRWFQTESGSEGAGSNHYELGGQGTSGDPGVGWLADYVLGKVRDAEASYVPYYDNNPGVGAPVDNATDLPDWTGGSTTFTSDTTIVGQRITTRVEADNCTVTLVNCWIDGSVNNAYGCRTLNGGFLVLIDTTISGSKNAVAGRGITARRALCLYNEDGFKDCHEGDFEMCAVLDNESNSATPHFDCMQFASDGHGADYRYCYFPGLQIDDDWNSASVIIKTDQDSINDSSGTYPWSVRLYRSVIDGGVTTLHHRIGSPWGVENSNQPPENVHVIECIFPGNFGSSQFSIDGAIEVWSGNVDGNGDPVGDPS